MAASHCYAAAPLPAPVLDTAAPRWHDGGLTGVSLLAVAEQGEGDTIQFVRHAKLVERGGGMLTMLCSPALKRLMTRADGVRHVVAGGDRMPRIDAWTPLLSLLHLLGTDRGSIPGGVPYLHPAPEDSAAWRTQLSGIAGLKVGLVWAGNPGFGGDRQRSPRFAAVAPLLKLPGLYMVLLQVGDGRRDLDGGADRQSLVSDRKAVPPADARGLDQRRRDDLRRPAGVGRRSPSLGRIGIIIDYCLAHHRYEGFGPCSTP